jgi:probable F420-dependent oxidoreductase
VRLGTWVYNLGLRHPIVAARAVQTLDLLSDGRALLGVGAGWVRGEYEAVGIDFNTRGRRLEEAVAVLRTLWRDDAPTWSGEHFAFRPVRFEPKPHQGLVPIHVGGESDVALRRAARIGDGWLGMDHEPASAADRVRRLEKLLAEEGRDRAHFEVTVGATGRPLSTEEIDAYAEAGVDRLIVAPWERGAQAIAGLEQLAREVWE